MQEIGRLTQIHGIDKLILACSPPFHDEVILLIGSLDNLCLTLTKRLLALGINGLEVPSVRHKKLRDIGDIKMGRLAVTPTLAMSA